MADFVAVLRKTLEGLGDPDAALRARVYDKARATVDAKLVGLNPPPGPGVAERQRRSLEDAIAAVEREYARASAPAMDPLEELESVFASLKNPQPKPIARPAPAAPVQPPADAMRPVETPPVPEELPSRQRPSDPELPDQGALPERDELPDEDELPEDGSAEAALPDRGEPPEEAMAAPPLRSATIGNRVEDRIEHRSLDRPVAEPTRRRGLGRYLAAAVVFAMLAGGAFGIWLNKDAFGDLLGLGGSESIEIAAVPPAPVPAPPETPASDEPTATGPEVGGPDAEEAPVPDEPAPVEAAPAEAKFTQRLTPEGEEVDPGPSGGAAGIGEGTSVAVLTQPPAGAAPPAEAAPADGQPAMDAPTAGDPAMDAPAAGGTATGAPAADLAAAVDAEQPEAAPDAAGETAAAPEAGSPDPAAAAPDAEVAAVSPADGSVPVGQKAIFYEERTSLAEGSAEPGSIVWSLVQESPGGNLPPEPAIRAEATIPGKDVQLRMTIKRNADKSLPASHIIEMIFLTPEGLEGGGIENILRVAMKSSEQEAGNPLIGIPAKIADGFFLVALNDTRAEIDANMTLLRRQSWIDVPLVYKSGRRALLTMEKGIPGDKVFDEALKAWQAATAG